MILNFRGTNGSGKTFLARSLLKLSGGEPIRIDGARKPEAYRGNYLDRQLYVLGSYETACGGMDTLPSVHDSLKLIRKYAKNPQRVIVYEGLMISHMYGTVGTGVALYKDRHVFAFLDTPLEVCISRVKERRLARGDMRPLNPTNLIADHARVLSCKRKIKGMGKNIITIPHEEALPYVLNFLKRELTDETAERVSVVYERTGKSPNQKRVG